MPSAPLPSINLLPLDQIFLSTDPDATELLLVRHGQQHVTPGPDRPTSDYRDPPLSELGRRQAATAADALAGEPIAAVYSSRLQRARDTARAVAASHGLETVELDGLEEVGIYRDVPEGRRPGDVVSEVALRGASQRFMRDRRWEAFPLTETGAELRQRVVATVEGILAAHAGERVVVACHGGVINAYLGWVLGISEDIWFRPAHASVSRVRARDARRALLSLNETHHLGSVDPGLVTV